MNTPERHAAAAAEIRRRYADATRALPVGAFALVDEPYVAEEIRWPNPDSSQRLDLFAPAGDGPFPLVVFIHGGGWHSAGKDSGLPLLARMLAAGFAYSPVNYRLVGDAPFPAAIEDCNDAIAWLRQHARARCPSVDVSRIGLIGHSAGAHLCATVAADSGSFRNAQKVSAVVGLAGIYDLDRERGDWPPGSIMWIPDDPLFALFPASTYDAGFARAHSPVSLVHRAYPPTQIVHDDSDALVPLGQARVFAATLAAAGAEVSFIQEHGKGHGPTMNDQTVAAAIAFFARHLRPSDNFV